MAEIDPNATQGYAVGFAQASGALNGPSEDLRQRIGSAVMGAIQKAQAEGVGDPEIIRQRILAARDAAL